MPDSKENVILSYLTLKSVADNLGTYKAWGVKLAFSSLFSAGTELIKNYPCNTDQSVIEWCNEYCEEWLKS